MAARWLLPLALLSFFSTPALSLEALSYWTHPSCAEKYGNEGLEKLVDEAIESTKMALDGLMGNDPDILECFNQIFKFDFNSPGADNDAHFDTFLGVMAGPGGVKNVVEAGSREPSTLRMYCNNQERYGDEPRDDDPILTIKNTQLPAHAQSWIDKENDIIIMGPPTRITKPEGAIMYVETTAYVHKKAGEPDERTTLDVFDDFKSVTREYIWPERLTSFPTSFTDTKGKKRPAIDRFYNIGSNTMQHELTHAVLPKALRTKDHARGWDASRLLNAEKSVNNADCYTALTTCARLVKDFKLKMDASGNGDLVDMLAT